MFLGLISLTLLAMPAQAARASAAMSGKRLRLVAEPGLGAMLALLALSCTSRVQSNPKRAPRGLDPQIGPPWTTELV